MELTSPQCAFWRRYGESQRQSETVAWGKKKKWKPFLPSIAMRNVRSLANKTNKLGLALTARGLTASVARCVPQRHGCLLTWHGFILFFVVPWRLLDHIDASLEHVICSSVGLGLLGPALLGFLSAAWTCPRFYFKLFYVWFYLCTALCIRCSWFPKCLINKGELNSFCACSFLPNVPWWKSLALPQVQHPLLIMVVSTTSKSVANSKHNLLECLWSLSLQGHSFSVAACWPIHGAYSFCLRRRNADYFLSGDGSLLARCASGPSKSHKPCCGSVKTQYGIEVSSPM